MFIIPLLSANWVVAEIPFAIPAAASTKGNKKIKIKIKTLIMKKTLTYVIHEGTSNARCDIIATSLSLLQMVRSVLNFPARGGVRGRFRLQRGLMAEMDVTGHCE